jgi:hypothetical protein
VTKIVFVHDGVVAQRNSKTTGLGGHLLKHRTHCRPVVEETMEGNAPTLVND